MNDPLHRPDGMSDKEYIEQLLEFFSSLKINQTLIKAYVALKNFVEENAGVVSDLKLDKIKLADKDDRTIDRTLKFSKELPEYFKDLIEMENMLISRDVDVEEEVKHLKGGSWSLEGHLRGDK